MADIAAETITDGTVAADGLLDGAEVSWPDAPSSLYSLPKWGQVWPSTQNSYGANINALTRLGTLVILLYWVLTSRWLGALAALIILWALAFYLDQHQRPFMNTLLTGNKATTAAGSDPPSTTQMSGGGGGSGDPAPVTTTSRPGNRTCPDVQCDGRDGCWRNDLRSVGGPVPGLPTELEKDACETRWCKMPTVNNPYMNTIPGDSAMARKTPACPPEQSESSLQASVATAFNRNLFANSNDLWQQRQMDRQFTTNPASTFINDRDSFMRWLYDTPFVCKDGDGDACFKQGY